MTLIRMTVIQMMTLIRNLLRGKLCNPIFIMMMNNKEERYKEIVHEVFSISSIIAHKYITRCKLSQNIQQERGQEQEQNKGPMILY